MRLKHFAALAVVAVLGFAAVAYADYLDTARGTTTMLEAFLRANGSKIHRFTMTPSDSVAESNLTAAGGTAVTYTLVGGERICLQAVTTDAYVQIIAAASVTAAGAKGWTLTAGAALDANCFTLLPTEKSVSTLCTATGPCLVKAFEVR